MIAGPNVQICDECVDICLAILNEEEKDRLFQAKEGANPPKSKWPPSATAIRCALCRMPVPSETALLIEERGVVCDQCVAAIQAAVAEAESRRS
jgi:hypothetical protein